MPRKIYDPKTKAAFMAAATEARKAGKDWAAAHEAAKAAGYTGSKSGIVQQLLAAGAQKRKKATKTGKTAPRVIARKPASAMADVSAIQKMIDELVRARVRAAIEKAIAALWAAAQ